MVKPEEVVGDEMPALASVEMHQPPEVVAEEEMPESQDCSMLVEELKQPARPSYYMWDIPQDGQPNRLLHEMGQQCTLAFLKKVEKKPAVLVRCIKHRRERDLQDLPDVKDQTYFARAMNAIFSH